MPDMVLDLCTRLERLENEVKHLRRLHHLRQRTFPSIQREQTFLARKVTGHVKWFNVKSGFGFITCDDTEEDVFIHKRNILKNDPMKVQPSVGDGEPVEFDVVHVKGRTPEAIHVTGPDGSPVKGSVFAHDIYPTPEAVSHEPEPSPVAVTCHSTTANINETTPSEDLIDFDSNVVNHEPATTDTSNVIPDYEYLFHYNSDDFPPSDSDVSDAEASVTYEPDIELPPSEFTPQVGTCTLSETLSAPQDSTNVATTLQHNVQPPSSQHEHAAIPSASNTSSRPLLSEKHQKHLADIWQELETFHADCCPELRNRLHTFLLLNQMECIATRVPSPIILDVLLSLTSSIIELDHHKHITHNMSAFQDLIIGFQDLRRSEHELSRFSDTFRPACHFPPPSHLVANHETDHDNANNTTASRMLLNFNSSSDNTSDLYQYGHLLDRIVKLFYLCRDRQTMICTLYNCYRRWNCYYNHASNGQITRSIRQYIN